MQEDKQKKTTALLPQLDHLEQYKTLPFEVCTRILNTIITHLWVLSLCGEDVDSVMSITFKLTLFNLWLNL